MFSYKSFSCETDIYRNDDNIVVRFYNAQKEHEEHEIVDLVIVDSGFGFISLKFKGNEGLLSGYLDKATFKSESMVEAAIEFVEALSPLASRAYIPYHIDLVSKESFSEYNGEY